MKFIWNGAALERVACECVCVCAFHAFEFFSGKHTEINNTKWEFFPRNHSRGNSRKRKKNAGKKYSTFVIFSVDFNAFEVLLTTTQRQSIWMSLPITKFCSFSHAFAECIFRIVWHKQIQSTKWKGSPWHGERDREREKKEEREEMFNGCLLTLNRIYFFICLKENGIYVSKWFFRKYACVNGLSIAFSVHQNIYFIGYVSQNHSLYAYTHLLTLKKNCKYTPWMVSPSISIRMSM